MWAKFKSFPLSVRAAIIFLTVAITFAVVLMPSVAIPLLVVFGTIASVIRVLVYFVHGE
jgi:uncharacterized membrane protein YjfL (UPF0719 family)